MRLTFIVLYIILYSLTILAPQGVLGQTYVSHQQKGVFEVDAEINNWPELSLSVDSSYAFGFSHEGMRLFVSLQVFDLKLQNQILMTGMTLWLDEKGKKKQNKGLHYPTGYKQKDILRDPMRFREVLEAIQDQKYEIAEKLVSVELLNFTGKNSRTWGKAMNPEAFNLKLDFDESGTLIYEASIPLELVFEDLAALKDPKSKGFSIGWETGELGRPELRGDDAVGLSGTNPANPVKFNSEWDRRFQKELNLYRTYAVPEKIWIKKLVLK